MCTVITNYLIQKTSFSKKCRNNFLINAKPIISLKLAPSANSKIQKNKKMSQAHSHSPHQQNIHQHVETLRSSSTTSLMANQDQNSSNGSSHRFIPNVVDPFLPAFCAQFSIVNEMPPLMFKEQPVFKTMDQSKDLYTYNLLQCPHHNEDVMKWLNCDDSNLVEGLHQILSNNPKSNEEM